MRATRTKSHRGLAAGPFWQWRFALLLLLFPGTTAGIPAAAQTSEGGAPSSSAPGPETGPAVTGGEAVTTPALPGAPPETLPPPSIGGLGVPNPAAPPYSVSNQIPTLISPPTLRLQPYAGVVPLQAYDPNAPAVLIRPSVFLGETFTDNVNYVPSPRKSAAITQLGAGLSVSVDTPRLQAVATGQGSQYIYLPSSSSTPNQPSGSLYANGHGTIYPDLFYVDAQSSLIPSTTLPGFGFQNLSTLPRNQQTLQFTNNISPYLIKSFGPWADTELRYTFSSWNYGGNTFVTTSPSTPGLNNLASTTLNEGTFIAVTGENFQNLVVRFTADAAELNGSPVNQSSQVSAFNDLQYNFTPTIAALGRAGYQNIRYPDSPAATFAGATWLAGGRLGTVGPDQPAYVALLYGRQQGVYGFTGSSQVNITPTLAFSANAVQGISSQGQFFASSLATSTLSPSGGIVNQATGLPIALSNPGLGISNNVYRQHLYSAGLTDSLPPNSYSLYGSYSEAQSLSTSGGVPTKTLAINFTYSRDIRPDASGYASVGFINSVNSPTVVPGTTAVNFSQRTNFNSVYTSVGLNYILGPTLTGSIIYSFSYQTNGTVLAGGRNGDVFANQLSFLVSKTF